MLTLGIPVLSAIGAWLVLDQKMTPIQMGGMAVALVALVVVVLDQPEIPTQQPKS
jgi:drug/metabolite transporter (DMT)-like permease